MLVDCRAGKIQRILVKSVSRFARNTLELIETTRELKERGVVVVFEEQGIDTSQMLGEMQLTLLAMAAQEESSSISKNVRWSYQKRMESGRFLGCSAPYGYKLEKGKFLIVPEEAVIVQRIFHLFLAGNGILSIARTLNEEGIKTRQGANWATSSIEYLLSNERYAGNSIFQKYYSTDSFPTKRKINHGERTQYYIGDTHEGIIPKETFEKAQQILQNHAHYSPPLPKPFQKRLYAQTVGTFSGRQRYGENTIGSAAIVEITRLLVPLSASPSKRYKALSSTCWANSIRKGNQFSPLPSLFWKKPQPGRHRVAQNCLKSTPRWQN